MIKNKRSVHSVSFNVADPYEKELLEFALKQQKFLSRYIKRLIEQDKARQEAQLIQTVPVAPARDELKREAKKEDTTGFL